MIFHIGEAAALMFLAYMLGWVIGYFARRLAARRPTAIDARPKAEAAALNVAAPAPALHAERPAVDLSPSDVIPQPALAIDPETNSASTATPGVAAAPIEILSAVADPDAPWRALQNWAPLYRPTAPVASQTALPEDPEDVVLLKRPVVAEAATSSLNSVSAAPAQRPGVAWFGDINGHPAPPHDTLLGRQTGGPNTIRMAARPQQLTARPKAPSAPAIVADTLPEPPAAILAPTVVPEAPPPAPPATPAVEGPAPELSTVAAPPIEEAAVKAPPAVASPLPPPAPARARPEPADVEWEELPSATPVAPPPPRVPRPIYERPPVLSFGRTPAPAVVDADAMLKAMMKDTPAPEPEQILPGELVAPPLSEIVAKQAPQLAAIRPAPPPPPAPPVSPAPPKPAERVVDVAKGDEAMNAIEGGWSRRRVRAMTDRPEMIDVSSAVAAAQSAVQQVLAQAETAPSTEHQSPGLGKPPGLQRARDGRRDSLREIIGVTSLDESTLNNLGIFHFDQIAAWTDAEVLWLENHVFARGRVGREKWQDQAHKLVLRRPSPPRAARS